MFCESFYQINAEKSLPLVLMSQTEWQDQQEVLPQLEKNYFLNINFQAKVGECCLITDAEGRLIKAYVGSGKNNEVLALAYAATRLPSGSYHLQQAISDTAKLMWSLAQYRYSAYKKDSLAPRILVLEQDKIEKILAEARAIFLVRDLINTPTNDLKPEQLSKITKKVSDDFGANFEEYVGNGLLDANYPAVHAVGRASIAEPRLLSLKWGKEEHPLISIIGKGVCFDSGGLDIKPAPAMRYMKKDMGGAAIALGLAQLIMSFNLPIRIHLLIPAVENSIGPDSFRPGDILTMRNGLTVEIDNTDAEGRLILADALVKASEEKPALIIDFATLTGAARTAVGTEIAAMFTNDDAIAEKLSQSSAVVNDPIWRLPLFSGYESMFDSSIADMANSSASPYAGAITAALFLQRFVDKDIPWVHFDLMAWNLSSKAGKPEGGEAMAMRAVMDYLLKTYLS